MPAASEVSASPIVEISCAGPQVGEVPRSGRWRTATAWRAGRWARSRSRCPLGRWPGRDRAHCAIYHERACRSTMPARSWPLTMGEEPAFCPACGQRARRAGAGGGPSPAPRLPRRPRHLAQPAPRGRDAAGARRAGLPGPSRDRAGRRPLDLPGRLPRDRGGGAGGRAAGDGGGDAAAGRGGSPDRRLLAAARRRGDDHLRGGRGRRRGAARAETTEVRAFGPDEIPWAELAFTTAESALRDWVASLPGAARGIEPELYVTGDPAEGQPGDS